MELVLVIIMVLTVIVWWRFFAFVFLICLLASFPPIGLAVIGTAALVWIAFKRR
jgi:hypothetical protein